VSVRNASRDVSVRNAIKDVDVEIAFKDVSVRNETAERFERISSKDVAGSNACVRHVSVI
jgi:ribosomal protein S20